MQRSFYIILLLASTFLMLGCSVQSAKFTYVMPDSHWVQAPKHTFTHQDLTLLVMANDFFKTSSNKTSKRNNGVNSPADSHTSLEITLFINSQRTDYALPTHSVSLHYNGNTLAPSSLYYGKTQKGACIGLLSKDTIVITPQKHACVVYKFKTERIPLQATLELKGHFEPLPHPSENHTPVSIPLHIQIKS